MLQEETLIFLCACLLGAALAAGYDALRLWRVLFPHHRFWINVEDFIFFVVATVVTFAFFLSYSDGGFRVFILCGQLLGAILYFFSLSLLLLRILTPAMRLLRKILYRIFCPFGRLLCATKDGFKKLLKKMMKNAKKFARNLQLHLKNRKRVVYNKNGLQANVSIEENVKTRGVQPQ